MNEVSAMQGLDPGLIPVQGSAAITTENALTEAGLIYRLESIPFSRWHSKARILISSATFFDAFDAL